MKERPASRLKLGVAPPPLRYAGLRSAAAAQGEQEWCVLGNNIGRAYGSQAPYRSRLVNVSF